MPKGIGWSEAVKALKVPKVLKVFKVPKVLSQILACKHITCRLFLPFFRVVCAHNYLIYVKKAAILARKWLKSIVAYQSTSYLCIVKRIT